MKKVVAAIVGGLSSVVMCAGVAVAAPAAPTAAASRPPVVYSGPNWQGPQVRPAHFYTITGDSSEWLNTKHWRHWSSTSAFSAGQFAYRSCFGSCDKFKVVRAAITLWRVRAHHGRGYFTRLRWVYKLKGHRHTVVAHFAPHDRGVLWIRQH